MKVLKFGGTSVGTPGRMHKLVKLVQPGEPVIIVLSAVSGTTNALTEIANFLLKKDAAGALNLIGKMEAQYELFIRELYRSPGFLEKGREVVASHFGLLRSLCKDEFGIREEKIVLAQGELLSTTLFYNYLQEISLPAVFLSALDFMRIDGDGEPLLPYIEEHLGKLLSAHKEAQLFITQGYICRNAFGEIDNLKRGGSDYTASLIGAAVRAGEIQIWTDIDGMHNNDPRYVKNTFPIAELSFDEAAELAYFGAKILHPATVLPARKFNIPVRLLNTMQPAAPGTLITAKAKGELFRAVAAKDGIVAIKLRSSRMLLAYGFLRKVFEVFEQYKTPIDMIATSEVAVSLTIDNTAYLDNIVKELSDYATVEVDRDQTIICIVGNFYAGKEGCAFRVMEAMKNIPIRMISYGGSENNISMLVNTGFRTKALEALNEGLFSIKRNIE